MSSLKAGTFFNNVAFDVETLDERCLRLFQTTTDAVFSASSCFSGSSKKVDCAEILLVWCILMRKSISLDISYLNPDSISASFAHSAAVILNRRLHRHFRVALLGSRGRCALGFSASRAPHSIQQKAGASPPPPIHEHRRYFTLHSS